MDKKIVIAINREYGSGGRTIGEMLARDLDIPYYDKDIQTFAAEMSGISESLFVQATDKEMSSMPYLKMGKNVYQTGALIGPESRDFTSEENLFNYQAKVIRERAEQESCVIVGHCGGFILRDMAHVVRVFVHAPKWFLLQEAAKKKSLPPKELEKYVKRVNKNRAEYYTYHTGEAWHDARNYDLCIDCSKLGFDRGVEIIKGYIDVRFAD